jgi:hypothetical protein
MSKYPDISNTPFLSIVGKERHIRKKAYIHNCKDFLHVQTIIKHFIRNPDPLVVPAYNYEMISGDLNDRYGQFHYSYDMKRLFKLTKMERDWVDEAGYVKWNHYSFNTLEWGTRSKENPTLVGFLKEVIAQNKYNDFHSGNFLKDNDGSYRIIDLEGFLKGESIDDPCNDWITR